MFYMTNTKECREKRKKKSPPWEPWISYQPV